MMRASAEAPVGSRPYDAGRPAQRTAVAGAALVLVLTAGGCGTRVAPGATSQGWGGSQSTGAPTSSSPERPSPSTATTLSAPSRIVPSRTVTVRPPTGLGATAAVGHAVTVHLVGHEDTTARAHPPGRSPGRQWHSPSA